MIQVYMIGRLGRDPEKRITQSGKDMVTMNVAVGTGDKAQWVKVTVFEKMCNWVRDAAKGDQIFVQGSLEVRAYQKKDGTAGAETQVLARELRVFKKGESPAQQHAFTSAPQAGVSFDEDIPF